MKPELQKYEIEHHADGAITVSMGNGRVYTLKDGNISAQLPVIKAIGIKHVAEVASHAINTIVGSRSHVIHFINGGLLRFAYNEGHLFDLYAENLHHQLSVDNELLFYLPPDWTPGDL